MSPEFLLRFNSSLTSDLSLRRTEHGDLHEVTLSVWLRPSPSDNIATPISYAAQRQSNRFGDQNTKIYTVWANNLMTKVVIPILREM